MIVEIIGTDGSVHYTRPHDHPDVLEALSTPGYSVRGTGEKQASGSLHPAGSEAATQTETPIRAIRLVLQLEDTPANRHTMLLASAAITNLHRDVEGRFAVLKREEVNIVEWKRPAQLPNK